MNDIGLCIGQEYAKMDAKGMIVVPKVARTQLYNEGYTQGLDKFSDMKLYLYEIINNEINGIVISARDNLGVHPVLAQYGMVTPDNQNRINLNDSKSQEILKTRDLVVNGNLRWFEVFDRKVWEAYNKPVNSKKVFNAFYGGF